MFVSLTMAGCMADQQPSLVASAVSPATAPAAKNQSINSAKSALASSASPKPVSGSFPVALARPDLGDRVQVAGLAKDAPGAAAIGASGTQTGAKIGAVSNTDRTRPDVKAPVPGQAVVQTSNTLPQKAQTAAPSVPATVEIAGSDNRAVAAPVRIASAAGATGLLSSASYRRRFPGLPGYEEDDPEPPLSASAERVEQSTANDNENAATSDAVTGSQRRDVILNSAKPAPTAAGPAIVTTTAYAPAVIEVNGVSSGAGRTTAHKVINTTITPLKDISPSARRKLLASRTPTPKAARSGVASGRRYWRAAYPHVVTRCFGPKLRNALNTIGRHFGREVQVTSGHRKRGRRRSMHRFCRAADIRVAGIRPSRVARFARRLPGINGVGTYRRKSIVHIDTRLQQMVWRY